MAVLGYKSNTSMNLTQSVIISMNTSAIRSKKEHERWDFRVMATRDSGDISFEVHKMYYDDKGKEQMYNQDAAHFKSSNVSDVATFMNMLKAASKKPILWKGERFPEVYVLDA